MSLYGSRRDVLLMKSINRELIHDVIEQQIGYYKPKIDQTNTNIYGESLNKFWLGPVLIPCLILRGDYNWSTDQFGPDTKRAFEFRFLKDDLKCANVISEVGDVILFNEDYFEVNGVNENRLIVGKDNDYAYTNSVRDFGASLSIILTAHYSRAEKLGINLTRL